MISARSYTWLSTGNLLATETLNSCFYTLAVCADLARPKRCTKLQERGCCDESKRCFRRASKVCRETCGLCDGKVLPYGWSWQSGSARLGVPFHSLRKQICPLSLLARKHCTGMTRAQCSKQSYNKIVYCHNDSEHTRVCQKWHCFEGKKVPLEKSWTFLIQQHYNILILTKCSAVMLTTLVLP